MSSLVQFKIFYGDYFEKCKMHRMKKERFELISYHEFTSETKWYHVISVLQTAKNVITRPGFLNRRLKPTVVRRAEKKSLSTDV